MKNIKLAIIGFGSMGQKHYNALNKIGIKTHAILDVKHINNNYNTKIIKSINELIHENINTAIISSPPNTHKYIAEKCLNYNINILIEKPAAEYSKDIEYINSIKKNNKIAVGYIERFNPITKTIINEIKNKQINHIYMIRQNPILNNYNCILRELSIHDVDLARFITKQKLQIINVKANKYNAHINSKILNASVNIYTNNSHTKKRIIYIYTNNVAYKANLINKTITKTYRNGKKINLNIQKKDSLEEELKAFLSWIKSNQQIHHTLANINDAKQNLISLGF